jgi:hypothetical protein
MTFGNVRRMSALPPKADISRTSRHSVSKDEQDYDDRAQSNYPI